MLEEITVYAGPFHAEVELFRHSKARYIIIMIIQDRQSSLQTRLLQHQSPTKYTSSSPQRLCRAADYLVTLPEAPPPFCKISPVQHRSRDLIGWSAKPRFPPAELIIVKLLSESTGGRLSARLGCQCRKSARLVSLILVENSHIFLFSLLLSQEDTTGPVHPFLRPHKAVVS